MRYKIITALILFLPLQVVSQNPEKPNIIIILADDLGWGDVGFHGSEIATPNIDRLAKEGVILNRYYTASICSPTRAGLLTGRYPDRVGIRSTGITPWRDYGLDTSEVTLPEILAEAGYKHRAILGKWHLGHSRLEYHPLKRGFTHFYGHYNGAIDYFTHKRQGELDWHNDYETSYDKGYATDLISREAIKCITDYNDEAPFFLYVAYNAPHSPLQAKEEDLLQYGFDKNKPQFAKGKGHGNTRRQTYSAMVTNMDRGIGEILETLKALDIEDNTLVLFHSDNGAGAGASSGKLRGRKYQEWEGGVRAPAIIKWPDGFEGERILDQVTGYIDVVPTLKEIAGLQTKPKLPFDGISILPVLKGEAEQFDRNFYLGYGAMVNRHWKLIKRTTDAPKMDLEKDMLFHISKDPFETEDVLTDNKQVYENLNRLVTEFDTIEVDNPVPPWGEGREGFNAPKEWNHLTPQFDDSYEN
jgi:arylsulfatase B